MARTPDKVVLITGAARGQGRSHAIKLAEEGADIIAVDVCADIATAPYGLGTPDDLAHTVRDVESLGRRAMGRVVDVRHLSELQDTVREAVDLFGPIDIVVANAGITSFASALDIDEADWQTVLDINLTGVWKTVKAVAPSMIEHGRGGSIILTSSLAGLIAFPNLAHYVAAKHGVTGLMRALAIELAPHGIRVNSVHPANVDTPMVSNPATLALFTGGRSTERDDAAVIMAGMNALPVPWVDPIDVSNAVLYLASDESRYITGTTTVIDAGAAAPFKLPHS
ncbi:mycofactocin-coupled SDR family oxidoreductase [Mycolicibacterium wolinskyi]|uniref:3-ketoacyl-ACP reductase n=1 Tax=Mycolicibacterium wolinskyi TaxID=59750 RepID=A0A1X2F5B9_9MYCO|nr:MULTISPECIES: mycofactocin-coupled SDR family oxidoreductase [Mycolicibacterium]MCV7289778.1 mycofactocin-coupled SDR family oxidoreductase [Mycolicibacterium wolinskyi]MCV7296375.1 mycofactocin-coupled SDR family oxidoreductase [Mycolicibacterium goodii]ORX13640.1 3-ketoacyl-ACP reductase [Mycolicibacterium wolinskyi]